MFRLVMVFILILALVGCGESKEQQAKKLSDQAYEHYKNGDFNSAIEVYQKSLDIYEDADTRNAMNTFEKERDIAKEVIDHLEDLRKANDDLLNAFTDSEVAAATGEIDKVINDIKAMDGKGPSMSQIERYINNVNSKLFNIQVNEVIVDTSARMGLGNYADKKTKLYQDIKKFFTDEPLPEFYKELE